MSRYNDQKWIFLPEGIRVILSADLAHLYAFPFKETLVEVCSEQLSLEVHKIVLEYHSNFSFLIFAECSTNVELIFRERINVSEY